MHGGWLCRWQGGAAWPWLLIRLGSQLVDAPELPGPRGAVEKLPVVKAVVVRRVGLRVVGGCDGRHLVAVDGVEAEEELHLFSHLGGGAVAPEVDKGAIHGHGAAAGDLAQAAVNAELLVAHAHVGLVGLSTGAFSERLELCGGGCLHHPLQRRVAEVDRAPRQEALEVALGDAADGVDVGRGAVVLGEVASQALVNVGAAKDKQEARPSSHPVSQLRQHERQHHANACLDVLQCEVFGD
mmetsp:Transcript_15581/g.43595  ORF Transcript_15581/g.43595 Transcript_15581/m.43595 type:complete len:240 (-) Transcript_15581:1526-2245(-)